MACGLSAQKNLCAGVYAMARNSGESFVSQRCFKTTALKATWLVTTALSAAVIATPAAAQSNPCVLAEIPQEPSTSFNPGGGNFIVVTNGSNGADGTDGAVGIGVTAGGAVTLAAMSSAAARTPIPALDTNQRSSRAGAATAETAAATSSVAMRPMAVMAAAAVQSFIRRAEPMS